MNFEDQYQSSVEEWFFADASQDSSGLDRMIVDLELGSSDLGTKMYEKKCPSIA